ncbi:hypothetical protein LR48_Vigan10g170200 [Vigna angularis]|uniref:Uncharacterized protein n=1 Tax=Phaseolus angularis TaxID=3914 RepID=A0A0L9VL79_PHAAN|nr:hypothetical protein LR48_Vigan10g170200 [Vigna angularis]
MVRRNSGEKTPVDVNVITGVASGPNADVFRSYLEVLAHNRINILTPSFDHVSEVDQNIIWNNLLRVGHQRNDRTPWLSRAPNVNSFQRVARIFLPLQLDYLSTLAECMLLVLEKALEIILGVLCVRLHMHTTKNKNKG